MAEALLTAQCRQCGVGLNILGGGRVRAHACTHCGALLDCQNDYRVLAQFRDMPRPQSPFTLGMRGDIDGVNFTIIGTLGQIEHYAHKQWRWTEHQLYSPTHGYAWLSVEAGHFIFSRKVRLAPDPLWIDSATVEAAQSKPKATWDKQTFTYYETSTAQINFVEGEFNWIPICADQSTAVHLLGDTHLLSFVSSDEEQEWEISHYLDAQKTCDAFSIAPINTPPTEPHPLQPYIPRSWEASLKTMSSVAIIGMLILIGYSVFIAPNVVVDGTPITLNVDDEDSEGEIDFSIGNARQLIELEVQAPLNNAWIALEFALFDEDDQILFHYTHSTEYYSGVEGGEHWTEGSQTLSQSLRLPEPGDYRLAISLDEIELDSPQSGVGSTFYVHIREGIFHKFWLGSALAIFVCIWLYVQKNKKRHSYLRWRGSDWDDD